MATSVKITKLMYGWSKWGGARWGLEKEHLKEWYCQSCGDHQTETLPSYMFTWEEDDERNFFRVCSKCKFLALKNKVENLLELIKVAREE